MKKILFIIIGLLLAGCELRRERAAAVGNCEVGGVIYSGVSQENCEKVHKQRGD